MRRFRRPSIKSTMGVPIRNFSLAACLFHLVALFFPGQLSLRKSAYFRPIYFNSETTAPFFVLRFFCPLFNARHKQPRWLTIWLTMTKGCWAEHRGKKGNYWPQAAADLRGIRGVFAYGRVGLSRGPAGHWFSRRRIVNQMELNKRLTDARPGR